jgi:predicted metal-dependent enzyme (double-stranded beta helix superfamily)
VRAFPAVVRTFDGSEFAQACVTMLGEPDPLGAISELVARAISDPSALAAAFPVPVDPDDDGVLYQSSDLLVVSALFPAGFTTGIHDHTVEAVIGVWSGHEDNHLYRRTEAGLEEVDGRRVETGEVLVLDRSAIHDVHSPPARWTAALHVYLGDLNGVSRHSWPVTTADPVPFDSEDLEERWMTAAAQTGLLQE